MNNSRKPQDLRGDPSVEACHVRPRFVSAGRGKSMALLEAYIFQEYKSCSYSALTRLLAVLGVRVHKLGQGDVPSDEYTLVVLPTHSILEHVSLMPFARGGDLLERVARCARDLHPFRNYFLLYELGDSRAPEQLRELRRVALILATDLISLCQALEMCLPALSPAEIRMIREPAVFSRMRFVCHEMQSAHSGKSKILREAKELLEITRGYHGLDSRSIVHLSSAETETLIRRVLKGAGDESR